MSEQALGTQYLRTASARNLATITKSRPQMLGITPKWFLKILPWINVEGGTYRINRQKMTTPSDFRISFNFEEGGRIPPNCLRAVGLLRAASDELLEAMANKFKQESAKPGTRIIEEGKPGDTFYILTQGKVAISTTNKHGKKVHLKMIGQGDYFGEISLVDAAPRRATVEALTACTFLTLSRKEFTDFLERDPELRKRLLQSVEQRKEHREVLTLEFNESQVDVTADHSEDANITDTVVDYDETPQEHHLSLIQGVLRFNTRVLDLFNGPHSQYQEQVRLAVESFKERQEWEIINNRDFGLLNVAARPMRIQSRTGRPTPDDMDELLSRVWKKPCFFLAHPMAIAAFGRECTRRGVPPPTTELFGSSFITWRGVPLVPCDKLEVQSTSAGLTSNILLMRVGEAEQGVIGLNQAGLKNEHVPGISVRLMGVDKQSIASYLMTLYYSVAVLVEDSLGVLENVDVSHFYDYN